MGTGPTLAIPDQRRARRPWRLLAALARAGDTALIDGGQERYYLPRVVAIRTERDELIGAAVALADVTKFHLLDRLKSDMVATVSHELKTPLTSVQMAIHLLLEEVVGPLTPKQVELLLAARQDADRILTMINDLLDLTRIEQGRVKLDLEPLAAAELVDEAVARFQPQAQARGVTLTAEVDGDRPRRSWSIAIGSSTSSTT